MNANSARTAVLIAGIAVSLHGRCLVQGAEEAAKPVALRVDSLTLVPSSGPVMAVYVKNLENSPYRGTVAVKPPEGWHLTPGEREVSLRPGETVRLGFKVERGATRPGNSYPIEVAATGAGRTVEHRQNVVVATAPYFKPTVDGDPSDWKEAVPALFTTAGRKTTIGTYWNRKRFALLVAVEEDDLKPYRADVPAGECDAVQVAIAAQDSATGTRPEDEASRFEFLLVAAGNGAARGKCFQLAAPGMRLAEAAKARPLAGLECADAEIAVRRDGTITYYECSLPWEPMRAHIRPGEGREFCLSVLVHDPDGTSVRDWGQAAGLWPWQRHALSWSRWQGATWGREAPLDNKTAWGMCSSLY